MTHTCQFFLCTSQANEVIEVDGKRPTRIYVCDKHRSSLVSSIKREFGKEKVVSDKEI